MQEFARQSLNPAKNMLEQIFKALCNISCLLVFVVQLRKGMDV